MNFLLIISIRVTMEEILQEIRAIHTRLDNIEGRSANTSRNFNQGRNNRRDENVMRRDARTEWTHTGRVFHRRNPGGNPNQYRSVHYNNPQNKYTLHNNYRVQNTGSSFHIDRAGPPRRQERQSNEELQDQGFQKLSKSLYQGMQIRYHESNWEDLPRSISKNLDYIFNNIVPPMPDTELRDRLKEINNTTKSLLLIAVQQHLTRKKAEVQRSINLANRQEYDAAEETARNLLRQQFRKKLDQTKTKDWLVEMRNLAENQETTTAMEEVPDNGEGSSWNMTQRGRKRSITSSPPPVSTSNRYATLLDDTEGDESWPPLNTPAKRPNHNKSPATVLMVKSDNTGRLTSSQPGPSVRLERIQTLPDQGTILPPDNATTRTTSNTDSIHNTSLPDTPHMTLRRPTTTPQNPEGNLLQRAPSLPCLSTCSRPPTIHTETKNSWKLGKVHQDTRTLVISDSQLRNIRNLPNDWEIHVFPGATLSHVATIVDSLKNLKSNVKQVVTHVGINNRACKWSDVVVDLNKLTLNLTKATSVKGTFMGVSIPGGLTSQEKITLQQLNDYAQKKLGKEHYITALPSQDVSIDSSDKKFHIHYDQDTLHKLSLKLKNHFLGQIQQDSIVKLC